MGSGREFSAGQKKIIDRYYQQRDTIAVQKLQEIVSELYLAEGAKADRLWRRVESHLKPAGANPAQARHALDTRDVTALAELVAKLN
ncbi:MAG: hypothetical protein AAGJ54_09675 [Planctomycetota bacterium]